MVSLVEGVPRTYNVEHCGGLLRQVFNTVLQVRICVHNFQPFLPGLIIAFTLQSLRLVIGRR